MKRIIFLSIIFIGLFVLEVSGQEGVDYDLKKPTKYENRQLGYEKTFTTKFKTPRHFIQNTVTHYNYYYNANVKLNTIIAQAKLQFRDDYTRLLPFYNYSLDATSRSRKDLDSIISKATMGILIHDLRNDWIDNLYLLMGEAYYFRKQFDTAYITFQFINWAFAPKEEGGYFKPIGSNANHEEGGNAFSISTDEKSNLTKRIFSLPPSRNSALVWEIRTYMAVGDWSRSGILIDILKHDPLFPPRLEPDLEEVQAYWFYNQGMWDSSAVHLEKALPKAQDIAEQARWEYLIAQLYERSSNQAMAELYYQKVIRHTYDPVLDVYARLNAIRQNKGNGKDDDYINENIHALQKMSRKEIYAPYQDIIFFTAAEMELERNDQPAAISFLLKTVHNSPPSSHLRNQAFMLLGDLSFEHKKYQAAKYYYDSVSVADLHSFDNANVFLDRKKALDRIVAQLVVIQRQDSLQRLAMMSEPDRTAYIKKMLKALHRQQGIDEEEQQQAGSFSFNNSTAAPDLFGTGADNAEWYFNNNSMKAKGFTDFKTKWGTRYNIDDWAVGSLASRQQRQINQPGGANQGIASESNAKQNGVPAATFESMLANVPTTPDKMKKSMDSVERALFGLGKAYQDGLPDYLAAIGSYDSLLQKFPNTHYREETLFDLYYCYKKLGLDANAVGFLDLLKQQYPAGKFTLLIVNPDAVLNTPENIARSEATRLYEQTYNAFIEGHFDQALEGKKKADSLYGEKYWTPQLLYIEAVYYVHTRYDSIAISKLNAIIKKYPGSAIGAKAKNMLDVLTERKRLEEYLSNLKIEREKDDSFAVVQSHRLKAQQGEMSADSLHRKTAADSSRSLVKLNKTDSTIQAAKKLPEFKSVFRFEPEKTQLVVVLLNKVDPVYVTETRNAFTRYDQENYYSKTMDIVNVSIDDTNKLVVINGFDSTAEALDYLDKAKKLAPRLIVPWLPVGKYSLFIISSDNLDLLKANKDVLGYRKFLGYYFPGKF